MHVIQELTCIGSAHTHTHKTCIPPDRSNRAVPMYRSVPIIFRGKIACTGKLWDEKCVRKVSRNGFYSCSNPCDDEDVFTLRTPRPVRWCSGDCCCGVLQTRTHPCSRWVSQYERTHTHTHTHNQTRKQNRAFTYHIYIKVSRNGFFSCSTITYVMTKTVSYSEHLARTAAAGYCEHEPVLVTRWVFTVRTHTHTHTDKLSKEETNRTTQKEAKKQ